MVTAKRVHDAEGDKRSALDHARDWQRRLEEAEQARNRAVLFASELGASYREISAATGIPHMTVKRIIERARRGTAELSG